MGSGPRPGPNGRELQFARATVAGTGKQESASGHAGCAATLQQRPQEEPPSALLAKVLPDDQNQASERRGGSVLEPEPGRLGYTVSQPSRCGT